MEYIMSDLIEYRMSDLIEQYNDDIDNNNVEVNIGSFSWSPSYVLQQMDPIGYKVGFTDFVDSLGIEEDSIIEDARLP
jgi:hypothetical protein